MLTGLIKELSKFSLHKNVTEENGKVERSTKFCKAKNCFGKEMEIGSMDRILRFLHCSNVECFNALPNFCAAKIWWAHLDSNPIQDKKRKKSRS